MKIIYSVDPLEKILTQEFFDRFSVVVITKMIPWKQLVKINFLCGRNKVVCQ